MPTIQLKAMTRELCHELYKHWTNDASIYMDMHLFQPYVYDEAAVNRYFDMKGQDASRRLFAIMLGDKVIGELQLKHVPGKIKTIRELNVINKQYGRFGIFDKIFIKKAITRWQRNYIVLW